MAKLATVPFELGYYLQVRTLDGYLEEGVLLWERGLDPMSWSVDEVLWTFWNGEDWAETIQTDDTMTHKMLIKL